MGFWTADTETKHVVGVPFMAAAADTNNKGSTDQLHHHHHHQIPYGMMQQSSSSSSIVTAANLISKDGGEAAAYDLGELDQALFLYLDGGAPPPADPSSAHHPLHYDQQRLGAENCGMRPPTLNIFPSQPMHVDPSTNKQGSGTGGVVSHQAAAASCGSKRSSDQPPPMEANPRNNVASAPHHPEPSKAVKREGNRRGPTSSSEQDAPKTPDPKTLRRLAQNREAARKSRLRKKAYVQQLESSRIRLTQLEQELQRARTQGVFYGGGPLLGGDQGLPVGINNLSSDAVVFDMEYTRWLEEHHRLMCELRAAVQEHLPENELRLYVDNCLVHFDEMINLKSMVAKSDVFHLVSGMWKTPAERCFLWIGGFRPSELLKIVSTQIEPLTEQQLLGIYGLQQSTQEAEDALTQGLEALNHSLSDTIASDALSCPPNMANYMGQMAMAMNKLSALESFVRQAENLRQQTLHRLHQLLTTRQAARCFLAIAEYFHRLRALSSLWLSRPRQD
ncbi:bZIP transcription factor TGA10 isoform X2 [Malania oleifera]|uniref:bZIP transcription factor TGA10 isoform X2 n=1 Tax=Malania oleifera TaxID=397392 RepID=UPI0025AEB65B|nr:bZIP transcription factor TGA10 isoform X2 [Malania oleifera]